MYIPEAPGLNHTCHKLLTRGFFQISIPYFKSLRGNLFSPIQTWFILARTPLMNITRFQPIVLGVKHGNQDGWTLTGFGAAQPENVLHLHELLASHNTGAHERGGCQIRGKRVH